MQSNQVEQSAPPADAPPQSMKEFLYTTFINQYQSLTNFISGLPIPVEQKQIAMTHFSDGGLRIEKCIVMLDSQPSAEEIKKPDTIENANTPENIKRDWDEYRDERLANKLRDKNGDA